MGLSETMNDERGMMNENIKPYALIHHSSFLLHHLFYG
jgi:hypothetical protein